MGSRFTSHLVITGDNLGLDGKFILGMTQSFLSDILGYTTADLKHDPPRFNNRYPVFHVTFSFAHAGFGWFMGHWFVREDTYPDFSTTVHRTHNCPAGSLNLARSHPTRFFGLQTEFSKG